jgi:hypothetical protein
VLGSLKADEWQTGPEWLQSWYEVHFLAGARTDDISYLAPELLDDCEPSHASDVFAFAIVMFETLKQELVAAEIAVQADFNQQSDAAALAEYSHAVMDGARSAPISRPVSAIVHVHLQSACMLEFPR